MTSDELRKWIMNYTNTTVSEKDWVDNQIVQVDNFYDRLEEYEKIDPRFHRFLRNRPDRWGLGWKGLRKAIVTYFTIELEKQKSIEEILK